MEKINLYERKKARQCILQALYQWQIASCDLDELGAGFLNDKKRSKFDKKYFLEFLHQVPAQVETIDENLQNFIDRKIEEVSPIELAILRMSIYEMLNRLDVPYRVVINEAVELAKRFGASESHKYINGVLDKAATQLRTLETKNKDY